jgi:DNA polymerase-3 subunit beta
VDNEMTSKITIPAQIFKRIARTLCDVKDQFENSIRIKIISDEETNVKLTAEATDKSILAKVIVDCVKSDIDFYSDDTIDFLFPQNEFRSIAEIITEPAEIEFVDNKIKINSGRFNSNILTRGVDNFVFFKQRIDENSTVFHMKVSDFASLFDSVFYAIPRKDPRRVLTGFHVSLADHLLTVTATDGKKLARKNVNISEFNGPEFNSCIIHNSVISKAISICKSHKNQDSLCVFHVAENQIKLSFEELGIEIFANTIEGRYPDCDVVIPKEFHHNVLFNKHDAIQSLKETMFTSDEKTNSVILRFVDNYCNVETCNEMGTSNSKFKTKGVESKEELKEEFILAFNISFLVETLTAVPGDECTLKIKTLSAPSIFKGNNDEIHLLMPIKLGSVKSEMNVKGDNDD